MFRLMTYNIGNSSENIESVIKLIKSENPNLVVLNEIPINFIDLPNLQKLANRLNLPNFCSAKSSISDNHTVLFSNLKLKDGIALPELHNSSVVVTVETDMGIFSVAGVHLAPNTEDTRLNEIKSVISKQQGIMQKIILGDFNSISPENKVKSKNLSNSKEPETRYDVINFIRNSGYFDSAFKTNSEQKPTVTVTQDGEITYYNLRLDYVFLSYSFENQVVDYRVLDTPETNTISDHYPIVVSIS